MTDQPRHLSDAIRAIDEVAGLDGHGGLLAVHASQIA